MVFGHGFDSRRLHQKSRINRIRLFLSKSQTWYIIDARSAAYIISSFGAVYHHASACISLRLDEIQHYVLVICNSSGIDDIPQRVADDIQGSRLDFNVKMWYNKLKEVYKTNKFVNCFIEIKNKDMKKARQLYKGW